jgi:hypothetical protein
MFPMSFFIYYSIPVLLFIRQNAGIFLLPRERSSLNLKEEAYSFLYFFKKMREKIQC